MCADTEEEKKKGGVSQWARVTTPACERVHVWVCEIEGAGEERGDTLADAATCTTAESAATLFTSEPSSVRLSWSFLFPFELGLFMTFMCEWDAWKRCLLRSDWWEPALRCGGWPPVSVPPLLGENWTPGVSTTTIMGCNLCTLQKREEHYKLLYEIAQVSRGMADTCIDCVCCNMWFIMCAVRRALLGFCCWCCCLFLKIGLEPRLEPCCDCFREKNEKVWVKD